MAITPLDIIQKEFPVQRRGYDADEVRAFLEEVREAYEDTLGENRRLKDSLRDRDKDIERLRAEQEEIRDAILLARRLSEEIEEGARREADLVVGEARIEAQRIIAGTHEAHEALSQEVHQLRALKHRLFAELRAVLRSHGGLLDELEQVR